MNSLQECKSALNPIHTLGVCCQCLMSSEQRRLTPQSIHLCGHCCVHGWHRVPLTPSVSPPFTFSDVFVYEKLFRSLSYPKVSSIRVLPFIDVAIKQTFSFTCYSHLLLPKYCTSGTVCMSHCRVTTIVLVSSPLLEWEVGFVYYSCNSLLFVFCLLKFSASWTYAVQLSDMYSLFRPCIVNHVSFRFSGGLGFKWPVGGSEVLGWEFGACVIPFDTKMGLVFRLFYPVA